jgi:hypothetical protein
VANRPAGSYIAAVILPPDNIVMYAIVMYALALKDPRDHLVALMGIQAAFRRLENDPTWRGYISKAIEALKPTAREMEDIIVDATR